MQPPNTPPAEQAAVELSLCPFCDSGDLTYALGEDRTSVVCKHCMAVGPAAGEMDDARKYWNTSAIQKRVQNLERENVCDICTGSGKALSGPCACGGSGKMTDAVTFMRQTIFDHERTIAALTEERAKLQSNFDNDLDFYRSSLARVAKEFGIESPLQLVAIAESDEETYADVLIKIIRQRTSTLEQERDGLRALYETARKNVLDLAESVESDQKLILQQCSTLTAMRQALEWSLDRLTDAVGNKIYGGATIEQIEEHSQALSLPTCGDSDKERMDWLEANYAEHLPVLIKTMYGQTLRAAIDSAKKGQSDE